MDYAVELSDASEALDLSNIRFQLIRLEDTITFHLIERVQFPLNGTIYTAGAVQLPESNLSFLDWMLREQERLHSLVRRYQSPDEHPFFAEALCTPILRPLQYPTVLHANGVNVNEQLKRAYVERILPAACSCPGREDRGESQENYGSAAVCDVACLQALSRRVHFGKFVAEAKFRGEPARFAALVRANDRAAIAAAITDEKVERKILERLRFKAQMYGMDPTTAAEGVTKINVDAVVAMYQDIVIPLTKQVEIEYLMQRLNDAEEE
ncbi:MAG: chorismate mutase aro7 [Lichina confinis]|nr:MAG: chorismate mutase aro7 [Lichina confinis]